MIFEPSILYEDSVIAVLDKPTGFLVHGDGKTKEPTLADWLLKKFPDIRDVGEPLILSNSRIVERSGIVHRLDRETSGVIAIAKTARGHAYLKKQFQNRTVKKIYEAFVYGVLKNEEGEINRPIGRSGSDFRKWSATRGARGMIREARTLYKVLQRGSEATYVEVRPLTGRTHQIRVHFKALNYPIVADALYAEGKPKILGFNRLALHARSLEFETTAGERVRVEAPLPADFEYAISSLGGKASK